MNQIIPVLIISAVSLMGCTSVDSEPEQQKITGNVAKESCSPGEKPSPEALRSKMQELIGHSRDPDSVKQKNISSPEITTCKGVLLAGLPSESANDDPTSVQFRDSGKQCTAWRVGITINPPNKYGGYRGKRTMWVWFTGDKEVAVGTVPDKCII